MLPDASTYPDAQEKCGRAKRALRFIGGLLLAIFLQPVFAIWIAIRWKGVSRWLRYGGIVLAFCIPLAFLWEEISKGTLHENLAFWTSSWAIFLTWSFFSASFMQHRAIRPSRLLVAGAAFIFVLFILGTVMTIIYWKMGIVY